MTDLRCPTCGKTNPAESANCQFCGAKLPAGSSIRPGDEPIKRSVGETETPSVSGNMTPIHPGEAPTKKDTGELEHALPAWLRDLRGGKGQALAGEPASTDESAPSTSAVSSSPADSSSGTIDWLAGLKADAEEEDIPDWLANISGESKEENAVAPQASTAPSGDVDWLSRLEAPTQEANPAPSISESAEPTAGLPDWFSSLRSEQEPTVPDEAESLPEIEFGERLDEADKEVGVGAPAEQVPDDTEWMLRLKEETSRLDAGSEDQHAEIPDWLSSIPATSSAPAEETPPVAEPSGEYPDWLDRLPASSAPSGAVQTVPEENPDSLNKLQTPPPPAESASGASAPDEVPDWLKSLQPPQETPTEEPRVKTKPFKTGTLPPVGNDIKGWLSSPQTDLPAVEPPAPEPPVEELPTLPVPGWISGGKEAGISSILSRENAGKTELPGSLPVNQQPDWLSSLEPEQAVAGSTPVPAAQETAEEEDVPEPLERGELPSWVQAMRPVEDVVADANIPASLPQSDLPVEERGPLAGLRGVLPVGVDIGLTRKPPAYSIKLQVSESQQKHAARLERSITSEREPGALRRPALISSAHILRWVVSAILIMAIGITISSGLNLGMSGAVYPPEMISAMNLVSGLQANAPVLVVFDYQPALSGELEAAAASMVDDLLFKGVRLTLLSTTPTGPALAERFMRNTQAHHAYKADEQYVNLGYLAGGPAGILDFAAEPAVAAPFTVYGKNAWTLSPLQGVQKFSDFALILVLTDDADVGRVWIEQAGPELDATPMAMVISAQAEPMIRPYYDSGQIKGLVTGLAGGHAYEQAVQRPGLSAKYWDAFGVAMLVAEIMIAVGAVWSAISALRDRRTVKEGGAQL